MFLSPTKLLESIVHILGMNRWEVKGWGTLLKLPCCISTCFLSHYNTYKITLQFYHVAYIPVFPKGMWAPWGKCPDWWYMYLNQYMTSRKHSIKLFNCWINTINPCNLTIYSLLSSCILAPSSIQILKRCS